MKYILKFGSFLLYFAVVSSSLLRGTPPPPPAPPLPHTHRMECCLGELAMKNFPVELRPPPPPQHLVSVFVGLDGTLDSASGRGCPARASFTVVSQTRGSCSPLAVTMNWTGSDRLDTSCSAYTVPLGLTPKLGSLVTNPTSLARWQSSNFTGLEGGEKREQN